MLDNTTTHTVTNESQDHVGALAKVLVSDSRGKFKNFPVIWGSGKKGSVSIYTGTIYKIEAVDNVETENKSRVFFLDVYAEHRKYHSGNFDCTLSVDEVHKLINE